MEGIFTDPNVVYVILLVGLWAGVTAAYVPGTHVSEGVAVVGLVGGLFLLALIPTTNWLALLLLVIGVLGFLVLPFVKQKWAPIAVVGLVLQAVGSALLFGKSPVSWLVIIATIGMSLIYHRFALLPALTTIRKRKVLIDENAVIGEYGRVVKALNPIGTVQVRSELWTAQSDQPLAAGEEIVVVDRNGLELYVKAQHSRPAQESSKEEKTASAV